VHKLYSVQYDGKMKKRGGQRKQEIVYQRTYWHLPRKPRKPSISPDGKADMPAGYLWNMSLDAFFTPTYSLNG
jgi:hypothetical protein